MQKSKIVYKDGWFWFAAFSIAFSMDMFQLYTINGVGDFVSMILLGTVEFGSDSFINRIGIYLLMVPVFIGLKLTSTLARYPEILKRGFPAEKKYYSILNMDHFSNAVFMMSLPAAFQDAGAWMLSITMFVFALFIAPRFVSEENRPVTRLVGVLIAGVMQIWLTIGAVQEFLPVPAPETVMPNWVLVQLTDTQVEFMLNAVQSLAVGPFVVPVISIALSSIFASRAMEKTPYFSKVNPESTSWYVIAISSFFGTLTYLGLDFLITGSLIILP